MSRSPPRYHPLHQSRLYKLTTRAKLSHLFGLTRSELSRVLRMVQPYSNRRKEIIGNNGKVKTRLIQQPRKQLLRIHVATKRMLSSIQPPAFLFCPVKRRSYVDNAAAHIGAREIRTIDISEFFHSTPRMRVYWFFHKIMLCETDVASVLAQLLTVDAHLATGSPVSPILSFFAFYDMWMEIAGIAKAEGCTITVYMDDITISGDRVPEGIMWQIRRSIYKRGLRYHKEKRYTNGTAEITGAIINGGRLRVPNRQLKKAHETRIAIAATSDDVEARRLAAILKGLTQQRLQVEGEID